MEVQHTTRNNNIKRDAMNNETSTSSDENSEPIIKYSNFTKRQAETASDNEFSEQPKHLQSRGHCKSMGNVHESSLNDYRVQNSISNVSLRVTNETKKFESLQIPIVGYEVMEERARFTIYKLKVEDDKTDQSWLVFRRYTDFVRLYTRIKSEQPNLMLPLPGKRWFRDNFEPAFLEERVKGLQVFVNAVLNTLPNNRMVREFFCLDEPPQVISYQPEVQAVYGALEDSVTQLKMQLKQKEATVSHLQKQVARLEQQVRNCSVCSTNISNNT